MNHKNAELVDFVNWKTICNEEGSSARYVEYENEYKLLAKTQDELLQVVCFIKKISKDSEEFDKDYKHLIKGLNQNRKNNTLEILETE